MKDAQKFATKVFIGASVLFGLAGVTAVLTAPANEDPDPRFMKVVVSFGFIVLSSFAVSVALKYLSDK